MITTHRIFRELAVRPTVEAEARGETAHSLRQGQPRPPQSWMTVWPQTSAVSLGLSSSCSVFWRDASAHASTSESLMPSAATTSLFMLACKF